MVSADNDNNDSYSHPATVSISEREERKEDRREERNQPEIIHADEDAEEFDMKFPNQYHNKTPSNMKVVD